MPDDFNLSSTDTIIRSPALNGPSSQSASPRRRESWPSRNPVMAISLGMVTGIGGGMARDVLLAEIPTVLRSELYAVAALVGAAVVVIGSMLHLASSATT